MGLFRFMLFCTPIPRRVQFSPIYICRLMKVHCRQTFSDGNSVQKLLSSLAVTVATAKIKKIYHFNKNTYLLFRYNNFGRLLLFFVRSMTIPVFNRVLYYYHLLIYVHLLPHATTSSSTLLEIIVLIFK